jgi:hypothetical protein
MTKRIDRTGETYGAVTVLGVDQTHHRQWDVRWSCCGKLQSVSCERVAFLARDPPKKCAECTRKQRAANHRDRHDRTGDQYGVATVIGIDPADPVRWLVRMECCGTIKSVSAERCGHMKRNPTKRCDSCNRHKAPKADTSVYVAPDDIYGLWLKAMDFVRRAA